jgi:hypothetical protein
VGTVPPTFGLGHGTVTRVTTVTKTPVLAAAPPRAMSVVVRTVVTETDLVVSLVTTVTVVTPAPDGGEPQACWLLGADGKRPATRL